MTEGIFPLPFESTYRVSFEIVGHEDRNYSSQAPVDDHYVPSQRELPSARSLSDSYWDRELL